MRREWSVFPDLHHHVPRCHWWTAKVNLKFYFMWAPISPAGRVGVPMHKLLPWCFLSVICSICEKLLVVVVFVISLLVGGSVHPLATPTQSQMAKNSCANSDLTHWQQYWSNLTEQRRTENNDILMMPFKWWMIHLAGLSTRNCITLEI